MNPTYLDRSIKHSVLEALDRQAAVALIGPRQVGKTTLAKDLAEQRNALYLDLEDRGDRDKLTDPALFLSQYEDRLVVLDEIHRVPELFQSMRGLIDRGRHRGRRTGRFLVLGSASLDLLRQSGESLAGRIEYIAMHPFQAAEVGRQANDLIHLWLRGGFPDSFLARNDADSLTWRSNFIRTYLERDIPQFGPRIPSETLGRLWTMLAHGQGTLLNASRLASGLSLKSPTVSRYIDLLADLLLVRQLAPYYASTGKRLVKSPKVYVRDTGLLHALLGIGDYNTLCGHPVVGASWETLIIENILSAIPDRTHASFYRTAAGAEIDLLLDLPPPHGTWAIEIKRATSAKPERGFYNACEDVQADRCFVVYAGEERYLVSEAVEAIGVLDMVRQVASAQG